ncbi:MAG: O-antigen ligase family protein, partial [Anaerolineales bacterium]|nr:O-antigen ligase family protein [Anaerolineales bacterium]
ILTSNLIVERQHFNHLMGFIMGALLIEGLIGNYYFFVTLAGSLDGVEAITEHSSAIHMNLVFVLALAVWMYKTSAIKKIALLVMVPIITIPYLATQRRAAFIVLALAIFLVTVVLYKENRRAFLIITPPLAIAGLLYILAFWNSTSTIGLPAQAIKSILFEEQANTSDYLSNLYRQVENVNLHFTLRQEPITGVGFGRPFYILIPMADISFFTWWQYLPHNSILWIWLKMGIGGFITTLFFIGWAVITGTRALRRLPKNELSAIALVATLYILMHFTYAYVDISWDFQSMILVGTMMGILNSIEHVVAQPVPIPAKRWHWQSISQPPPGLLPLTEEKSV